MRIYDNSIETPDDEPREDAERISSTLYVHSKPGTRFEYDRFLTRMHAAPWRDQITQVILEWKCQLPDAGLLEALPNVKSFFSRTEALKSLRGVAAARHLEGIFLFGGKKARIALDDLPATRINRFEMEYARKKDLVSINKTTSIGNLRLTSPELMRFSEIANLQLESLIVIRARMKEVSDLDSMAADMLQNVWLGGCRYLEKFSAPTHKLQKLDLDGSGKFDLTTLELAPNLRMLRVAYLKRPFSLGDVSKIPALRELSLAVNDGLDRKSTKLPINGFRALRKLWINPARDDWMQKISAQLPEVRVAGGKTFFINGIAQPDFQAFYAPLSDS